MTRNASRTASTFSLPGVPQRLALTTFAKSIVLWELYRSNSTDCDTVLRRFHSNSQNTRVTNRRDYLTQVESIQAVGGSTMKSNEASPCCANIVIARIEQAKSLVQRKTFDLDSDSAAQYPHPL
jgi:hypothetical protein